MNKNHMCLVARSKFHKRYLVMVLVAICTTFSVRSQIVINEEPRRLYYDFAAKRIRKFKDMRNFRDVFHCNKYLMGKNRIFGNFSYNTGRILLADEHEVRSEYRQALGVYLRWRFFEEFSINTTFFIDFNKRATARWTSDYSYAIGRYNWRLNKFNYGYENYLNNKYSDNLAEMGEKFLEGYYFLSYQNGLPKKMAAAIRWDSTTLIKLIYFGRCAARYRDEFNQVHPEGKPSAGVAARYTIVRGLYIEGAVYYYFIPHTRQPWDPDYSYGFGYFDWRSFRISITYGNWAINRFDPRDRKYPSYGFIDGQFRLIANWTW